jgi:hypothetical protein
MRLTRTFILVSLLTAACLPAAARASVSVAGGGFIQSTPSTAGGAVIVSSGASIPEVPLELQGSLLIPIGAHGGYAATAEIRGFTGGGYGGAYVGAGAGIGNLSTNRNSATIFTIFAGKSIAPLTSIELRLYRQTDTGGATAGFVGVRFSF